VKYRSLSIGNRDDIVVGLRRSIAVRTKTMSIARDAEPRYALFSKAHHSF
jgi:hypothetical protein